MIKKEKSEIFNYLLILMFGVVIGIFLIGMPKYSDDYWYMEYLSDRFFREGITDLNSGYNPIASGFPVNEIFSTWHEHWQIDNLRLGNLLVVFFLIFPKWVGSGLAVLVWFYCMIESLRLAEVNIKKSAAVMLALMMWGIFLPWSNRLGSLVFQFNYVLGTGVSLWFLSRLFANKKHAGISDILMLFFTALITGWWQEAFSIGILAGCIALMVFYRGCRNRRFLISVMALVIGILFATLSPGTATRLSWYGDFSGEGIKDKFLYIIAYNLPYYILWAVVFFSFFKVGMKKILQDKIIVFSLISGLIPILMMFVVYAEPRVTWWTQVISIIAIIRILHKYYYAYWHKYKIANLIWLIPGGVLMFAHLITADVYVLKMRRALSKAITEYLTNPDETVYGEVISVKDQPLICAKMPDVLFYSGVDHQLSLRLEKISGKRSFAIIPEELRIIKPGEGEIINKEEGIRVYKDRLIMEADTAKLPEYEKITFDVDYGAGPQTVYGYAYPFKTKSDGKEYYYINLMSPWLKQHFGTIKNLSIRQNDE